MKWCCPAFQAHFSQRHERGSFVFAAPRDAEHSPKPAFFFGFRALEPLLQRELADAVAGRLDGCMTISCHTGMRFCPWCGAELREFYQRTWQELVDEALLREFNVI